MNKQTNKLIDKVEVVLLEMQYLKSFLYLLSDYYDGHNEKANILATQLEVCSDTYSIAYDMVCKQVQAVDDVLKNLMVIS